MSCKARRRGIEGTVPQTIIYTVIFVVIVLVIMPVALTIIMSIKNNYDILRGVFSLPTSIQWSNWSIGFKSVSLNMLNSIIVSLITTALLLFISSLSAYVFARHNFKGKNVLFASIIALMIVPPVLTLTPLYVFMKEFNIDDTWIALLLPYIGGGQISAIFLLRTFMSNQPEELFEAAKIDSATEMQMYFWIAIPLAVPILAIQAVNTFGATYNDFLWPSLIINTESRQMLMPILRRLTDSVTGLSKQMGVRYAMYLISGIPLIFSTLFGLRYFVSGDFSAGMKL